MATLEQLSIRQLAAQCIMERVDEEHYTADEQYREQKLNLVREHGIGGICVFKGNLERTAQMIRTLQEASTIPLIVAADFEYGLPMRLDNGTSFPHAMALGKGDNLPATYRVAESIAREAKAVGIHWNFAPCCDVNSNPANPIINIRSFGTTPDVVAAHAEAYIAGTQQEHVLACAKHFPGHGDTAIDSHLALPVIERDAKQLAHIELAPFVKAIAAGVRSIMVGHLAVPALGDAHTPASLSPLLTSALLRDNMGFRGLIVTDAMDMRAIADAYPAGEAAVRAIEAGADVVLLPADVVEALDALEKAVESGRLSRERLVASVQRIMEAKQWCGVLGGVQAERDPNKPPFDIDEHRRLALETAGAALEWFGEPAELLPLSRYQSIAGFAVVQEESIESATSFFTYVAQCYELDCHFAFVNEEISDEDIETLAEGSVEAELVLVPVFLRARAYQGSVALPPRIQEIIRRLAEGRPVITLLFGNPYIRENLDAQACLCAYSDSEGSLAAAAAELAKKDAP